MIRRICRWILTERWLNDRTLQMIWYGGLITIELEWTRKQRRAP